MGVGVFSSAVARGGTEGLKGSSVRSDFFRQLFRQEGRRLRGPMAPRRRREGGIRSVPENSISC